MYVKQDCLSPNKLPTSPSSVACIWTLFLSLILLQIKQLITVLTCLITEGTIHETAFLPCTLVYYQQFQKHHHLVICDLRMPN